MASKYLEEYRKEYRRVRRFIRAAEKRGYKFAKSVIPKKPNELKRITKSSVEKLKKLTPDKLYKKSTVNIDGKKIKGTEYRKQERQKSARKAAQTRKQKQFERERRKKDEQERENLRKDKERRERFNVGNFTINRIYEMIAVADIEMPASADYLRKVMDEEIEKYGRDSVAWGIAKAPKEAIESAEIALRYSAGAPAHDNAIISLLEIIRGEILTPLEMQEIANILEQDEYI